MEIFFGVFLVVAWIAIVLFMRLVTTFLHEMGHAIPGLLFTDKPVKVFVGSYGNEQDSWSIKLGRLQLFFRPRVYAWTLGQCHIQRDGMSFYQQVIMLLGGPFASVLFGGLALWAIIRYQFGEVLFVVFAAFLLSAIWDLFVNLVPRTIGANGLHGGQVFATDGAQLLSLIYERRLPADYHTYAEQIKAGNYQAILDRVERDIEANTVVPSLLPLAINAYEATKEYGGALSIYEYLHKQRPLRPDDYFTLGELYRKLNNYQEAINCYGEYLHENYTDFKALHARGLCYQQMAEHGAAIQEFTVALRYNNNFPVAWRDRAFSLLRLNEFQDAKSDLDIAAKLEPEHPRLFLYQSFYLEAVGEYGSAHSALLKAKSLGDDFHGIEFRLSELERKL